MSDPQAIGAIPYEVYRAQRANEARMEAATLQMDVAPPGGRYLEGGRWVDANGKPVEAPKAAAPVTPKPQEPTVDEGPYEGKPYTELKELAEARGLDAGRSRESALAALQAADAANPPA